MAWHACEIFRRRSSAADGAAATAPVLPILLHSLRSCPVAFSRILTVHCRSGWIPPIHHQQQQPVKSRTGQQAALLWGLLPPPPIYREADVSGQALLRGLIGRQAPHCSPSVKAGGCTLRRLSGCWFRLLVQAACGVRYYLWQLILLIVACRVRSRDLLLVTLTTP